MAKEKPIDLYKNYCNSFEDNARKLRVPQNREDSNYSRDPLRNEETKQRLGFDLYYFTKDFLNSNKKALSPKEKGDVFVEYIRLWERCNCKLSLEMVGYAGHHVYTGYKDSDYIDFRPMLAGFDLSYAVIKPHDALEIKETIFLMVDLSGAEIYSSVHFNKVVFIGCNLITMELWGSFSGVNFVDCDLTLAKLAIKSEKAFFRGCTLNSALINHPNCPFFNCAIDGYTSGLDKNVLQIAREGTPKPSCQVMTKKEVQEFWKDKLSRGEFVPEVYKKLLPGYVYVSAIIPSRRSFEQAVTARTFREHVKNLIDQGKCTVNDIEDAVNKGANLNVILDQSNSTLLTRAIKKGSVSVAVEILKKTHDKYRLLQLGSPLHVAARSEIPEMLEAILNEAELFANVNEVNKAGVPLIEIAITNQSEEQVRILIEKGAKTHRYPDREDPIAIAVRLPNTSIAKRVIVAEMSRGAKIEDWVISEAMVATGGPSLPMLKMLVQEFGINLIEKNQRFILDAVRSGKPEVVAFFLEKKVDPNFVYRSQFAKIDKDLRTPLHLLSEIEDEDSALIIAEILIQAGANIVAETKEKRTPLVELETFKPEFKKLIAFLREKLQPPSTVVAASSVALEGKVVENQVEKI